jgi:hypothetical protein
VEIFHSLEQSPVVSDFEVLEFRTWEDGFYFKIKIVIQDGSVLFAREFIIKTRGLTPTTGSLLKEIFSFVGMMHLTTGTFPHFPITSILEKVSLQVFQFPTFKFWKKSLKKF